MLKQNSVELTQQLAYFVKNYFPMHKKLTIHEIFKFMAAFQNLNLL